jgi:hypothetical protein
MKIKRAQVKHFESWRKDNSCVTHPEITNHHTEYRGQLEVGVDNNNNLVITSFKCSGKVAWVKVYKSNTWETFKLFTNI